MGESTGKKATSPFTVMIIAHIAAMLLYIPMTGGGYRDNLLYSVLCAAVTVYEINICRKDDRHEIFWLVYLVVIILGIICFHKVNSDPKYIAAGWEYIVLFLGSPVYMGFSIIKYIVRVYWIIETAAALLAGYLLFITIKRMLHKKSVKSAQDSPETKEQDQKTSE